MPTAKKPEPKEPSKTKISANDLLLEILRKTNIELVVNPLDVKTVSDGSIIITKPRVLARYKDGR